MTPPQFAAPCSSSTPGISSCRRRSLPHRLKSIDAAKSRPHTDSTARARCDPTPGKCSSPGRSIRKPPASDPDPHTASAGRHPPPSILTPPPAYARSARAHPSRCPGTNAARDAPRQLRASSSDRSSAFPSPHCNIQPAPPLPPAYRCPDSRRAAARFPQLYTTPEIHWYQTDCCSVHSTPCPERAADPSRARRRPASCSRKQNSRPDTERSEHSACELLPTHLFDTHSNRKAANPDRKSLHKSLV